MSGDTHCPVMLEEVLAHLQVKPGQTIIDSTLGPGGYSEAILESMGGEGLVLGIDQDERALEVARRRLAGWGAAFLPHKANFAQLAEVLAEHRIEKVDAVVADLGVSLEQLQRPEAGFSFMHDGPLSMRMDTAPGKTAADIVNTASASELERIFREYGEERFARRIARAIEARRRKRKFTRTADLASLVERTVPGRPGKRHKATRVFQALRIAVNDELSCLTALCEAVPEFLRSGGVFVCVSYHSLEDRIVKQQFRLRRTVPVWEILTPKPLTPSKEEVKANVRSRGAKLRAARRV